jgi:hypothetical protein
MQLYKSIQCWMNCVEALGTVLSQYNAHEMDKSSMFHQAVLFFRVSAVRDRKKEGGKEEWREATEGDGQVLPPLRLLDASSVSCSNCRKALRAVQAFRAEKKSCIGTAKIHQNGLPNNGSCILGQYSHKLVQ